MKILRTVLLVVIVFMVGTIGYVQIEGWPVFDSFYMTAISITTVGFGETKPLSEAGKIFTVFIIFMGLGSAAVFATTLASAFVESHFKIFGGTGKMLKKINRLKGHYIICGYGGVGSAIAGTLSDSGIDFVVVEQNEDTVGWAEKRGFLTVVGKATYDETLIQAGIKNAKGIVVCMGDDSLNMYVSLAARELNSEIYIIARGYKSDIESRLVRAGANNVVYPVKMGGEQIAHQIKRQYRTDDSNEHTTGAGFSVMGYSLRPYKHYGDSETTVGELKIKLKAINVVSLKRSEGEEKKNPDDRDIVCKNDSLLLVTTDEPSLDRQAAKEDSGYYWSEKYNLGYQKLDSGHEKIFYTIYDFITSIHSGSDKEILRVGFNKIVDETIEHFKIEEKLLTQYKYPKTRAHIKEHKKLLKEITDLNRDREYNFSIGIEDALFSSFLDHIMEGDREFVTYLKENYRG